MGGQAKRGVAKTAVISSKQKLEAFLRRDPYLHCYSLGDLDDFFWPKTTFFGLGQPELQEVALLYRAPSLPVLLAFTRSCPRMHILLAAIESQLPPLFYAHLSADLLGLWPKKAASVDDHGLYYRLQWRQPASAAAHIRHTTTTLTTDDLDELLELYKCSYPGNWFDPRMLETGQYRGIRKDGQLVATAGVHVYSKRYRVAVLGNIATRPGHRGQGLATSVTAALCASLSDKVHTIGLNVSARNHQAVRMYRRVGFVETCRFRECTIRR